MAVSVRLRLLGAAAALSALVLAGCSPTTAEAPKAAAGQITGVVAGQHGGEAGVWVIAETKDLPTRYAKIVVTDDQGRFLVPDLPKASYRVFARGYGIADSPSVQVAPGASVTLKTHDVGDAEAAQGYPAAYWYALLKIPPAEAFSGPKRDPLMPPDMTQNVWVHTIKIGACIGCHQLGDKATRTIPAAFASAGNSEAQWLRRLQAGPAARDMLMDIGALGAEGPKYFADWTDRIAKGELPKQKPERPTGIERNLVLTTWDWLDDQHYLHDAISTDPRNPTVNAYGKVYGSTELSTNQFPWLDPVHNTVGVITAPVRDKDTPIAAPPTGLPSAYWGDKAIWDSQTNIHNPMFDKDGRLWMTASIRDPAKEPDFCKKGSSNPYAQAAPLTRSARQLSMYDPKTGKYTFVDTCFTDHHLQFDANDVLWTSGGVNVIGWLDTKQFLKTGDAEKAQGWAPVVLDTNGNGKRDAFTEIGQPQDPGKDMRVFAPTYAILPDLADGTIWGSVHDSWRIPPISIVHMIPGADPAHTALSEVYNVPAPGFGVRGGGITSDGVVWIGLSSGHLASFDRRKCKGPLNGPKATGDHCPEGWTLYRLPGPSFEYGPDDAVESPYYTWVDQHDVLGLGKNTPMVTGNLMDGFHALVNGKWVNLRVPYPLGFYAKGVDGRIDDPNAGWKGRGLWTTSGDRTPWHHEGGLGNKPMVVHIQLRPGPLAG